MNIQSKVIKSADNSSPVKAYATIVLNNNIATITAYKKLHETITKVSKSKKAYLIATTFLLPMNR